MYYKETVDKVIKELNSNVNGLSSDEALKRLENYGLNKIADDKKVSKIALLLKQFQDAMIIMLLIVSIVSFVY